MISTPIARSSLRAQPSHTLRFAATVAAYADALRGGTHIGDWSWDEIAGSARQVEAGQRERGEFVELVELAEALTEGQGGAGRP